MIFRNVKFSNYTSCMEENGPVYRLHMEADITGNVTEEMGWDVLDDHSKCRGGLKSVGLDGSLVISDFVLKPNDTELKLHEIGLSASEMRSFQLKKRKEDGHFVPYLSFILTTPGPISKIDKYWRAIRMADAQLTVTVVDKQQTLYEDEEEEAPADENQSEMFAGDAAAEPEGGEPKKRGRKPKDATPIDKR